MVFKRSRKGSRKIRRKFRRKSSRRVRAARRVHYIKRTFSSAMFVSSTTAATLGAYSFQLSDLPNYTEFTQLFDEYKICAVKVKFMPLQSETNTGTTTNYQMMPFFTVIDPDDTTAPADLNTLFQYESLKAHFPLRPFSRYIKPRMSVGAYSGAFSSYANVKPGWVDASSPSVQHYGLKIGLAATPNVVYSWQMILTYYMKFRTVH